MGSGEETTAVYVESKNCPRIVEESKFYIARYTDATGRFRERSTGRRDLRNAEHKLNTWLQEVEKVKAGILTQEEFETSGKIHKDIEVRITRFKEHLQAKGATERHIRTVISKIRKICEACKSKRMCDFKETAFVQWLNKKVVEGMGAKTRNSYREAMNTFCNWAVGNKSLASNPFAKIPRMNVMNGVR
jgi:hypothetical protein